MHWAHRVLWRCSLNGLIFWWCSTGQCHDHAWLWFPGSLSLVSSCSHTKNITFRYFPSLPVFLMQIVLLALDYRAKVLAFPCGFRDPYLLPQPACSPHRWLWATAPQPASSPPLWNPPGLSKNRSIPLPKSLSWTFTNHLPLLSEFPVSLDPPSGPPHLPPVNKLKAPSVSVCWAPGRDG